MHKFITNIQKKPAIAVVLLCGSMLLDSGCSLLPREDDASYQVLIETTEDTGYTFAQVTRADVVNSQRIYCNYSQVNDEDLSFGTEGRGPGILYVERGDTVKKGQLLAELNVGDLDAKEIEYQYNIDRYELSIKHTKETAEMDVEDVKELRRKYRITQDECDERIAEITEKTEKAVSDLQDSLNLEKKKLEEVRQKIKDCRIYAGMDGTVTYLSTAIRNGTYEAGERVMTIIDTSYCMFVMDRMEYADFFPEGAEITLEDSNNTYTARVLPWEEGDEQIRMETVEVYESLGVGSRAFVTLILGEAYDVNALPVNAVHQAAGQYYVYLGDGSGLKEMQYITIGLKGNTMVEITGGLSEGDVVIVK